MVKTFKKQIGDKGEVLASEWLKKNGFKILDRNFLTKYGEIDIVGSKNCKITFFEVKTVTRGTNFEENSLKIDVTRDTAREGDYEPEDNIHPWKLKRLAKTIEIYLSDKNIDEDKIDWQLDCLSVYLDPKGGLMGIERLEDVF